MRLTPEEFWVYVFVAPLTIFVLLVIAGIRSKKEKERDRKIEDLEKKVKELEEKEKEK